MQKNYSSTGNENSTKPQAQNHLNNLKYEIANELGIESIPLVLYFKDGKQMDALLGYNSAAIVAGKVEKLL